MSVYTYPPVALSTSTMTITSAPLVASFQEITNLTNVAQTFTAPANAKWAKVHCLDTNPDKVRVKVGAVATASSGHQFEPGRSEDFQVVGNISVISETTTINNYVCVTFGV